MRILLINVGRKTEVRIPQGLLYLASAIQAAGHDVVVHDETLATSPAESLEQILSYDAEVIGLSVYTVPWQLRRIEDISRAIKAASKSTVVVWGGWHATLYPGHSILNENVDIVVRGPGEMSVCQLLEALSESRSLRNIPGLTFKEKGQIIQTGPECIDPVYLFPPLNFELIDVNSYLKRHDRGAGILPYVTTRGCHADCHFCVIPRLFNRRVIRKPKNQILGELEYLLKYHSVNSIDFSDDNSFRNNREALDLCNFVNELTKGRGIPWRCSTRIDTLNRISGSTYKKLVSSGCTGLVVGLESGVDRVLELMGKRIVGSQIQKVLTSLADFGLHENLFSFLFDFTGETEKEAEKTLALARKTRLMFPESDINLHVFFPANCDNTVVPQSTSQFSSMLKFLERYYADYIVHYCVGRIRIEILRYYFAASKQRESKNAGVLGVLRKIHQKLILLRIKYGIFVLPFEYYLSDIVIKRIKKVLTRIKLTRNKPNFPEKIE